MEFHKKIVVLFIFTIVIEGCNNKEQENHGTFFCTEINSPVVDYIKHLNSFKSGVQPKSLDADVLLPKAVFLKKVYWGDEIDTLCVSFIDGSPKVQERVMEVAREWEEYCRIRFNVDSNCQPDITISLVGESATYESYVGKESRGAVPSMKLQQIEHENDCEFRSIVLHEFGHALGLVHEHQHPEFNIPWNKKNVYKYYKENHSWSRTKVDTAVFMRYELELVEATEFDTSSIMIYQIPPDFLCGDFPSIEWVYQISEKDAQLIGEIYPPIGNFSPFFVPLNSVNIRLSTLYSNYRVFLYNLYWEVITFPLYS